MENTQLLDKGEPVRVGVLFTAVPEGNDSVVVSEDGHRVDYTEGKDQQTKSFFFDLAVTSDNIQRFHADLLQPLTASTSGGCNRALLMCGTSTEEMIDLSFTREVLTNLLSDITSREEGDLLICASFLEFHPDGDAVDLLCADAQPLTPVVHPVLGCIIRGLSEVCLDSVEEACDLYVTCRQTLKAEGGPMSCRCSSLFTVTVEWKLHPEEVEFQVYRSKLQLFSLAGGASRNDLRGPNPLVEVLDRCPSSTPDILPLLLNEALTGNSSTALIYCIQPGGALEEETPAALALAQKARHLVTRAVVCHWCPRATERETRDRMTDLRKGMMSRGESETDNTYRLAELTQHLQIVKDQSWDKKRKEAEKVKFRGKRPSIRHFSEDHNRSTVEDLEEQLRQEMEDHIREDKGNVEKVQRRLKRILQLREALRQETQKNVPAEDSHLFQHFNGQYQLEHEEAQERRRQLKEDHGRLIHEEVEKMERDLAQEQLQTEDPQRELAVLTRERRVLVLQMEALRAEAQQAETDLQQQCHTHHAELRCVKEESLQILRTFRQAADEQRKVCEGRYRGVLLEAVQDAIYLSAQNQQLQADIKQLREALGETKDTPAAQGHPTAEV